MASTQSKPINSASAQTDPFDSLLTLEDDLYTTAYSLGATAGSRSGRIEGRLFGLEQGFEKFATLGALHGRSVIWGSRLPTPPSAASSELASSKDKTRREESSSSSSLPAFTSPSTRLTSAIHLLHGLADPATFSTENTEEAVADYDDRVRRAGAKAKVIERIVGETSTGTATTSPDGAGREGGGGVRLKGEKEKKNRGKGDENMEDFAGSRLIR
ncbi:hypothetical protein DE146DRAFT_174457 [Phaeosphaeria sp. MPI-PUGE-AT-0046c]|nr:hypothetical protein DE146DRAFT_174457 [Phaeosphaeria sp. MPI-PUGE-AT-0046c]